MAEVQNPENPECWEDVAHGNPRSLLAGMQNGAAVLENSLEVSYKAKHTFTRLSNNRTHLPKEVENLHPHKPLHVDVL